MPVKVKLGTTKHPVLLALARIVLVLALIVTVVGGCIYGYYYHEYRGLVQERLAKGPLFTPLSQVYAAPQEIRPGQKLTADSIAASLRRAGYNSNPQMGSYELRQSSILIKPGPQSYLAMDGATINTASGEVSTITAENGAPLAAYKIEPQLITALSEDKNRTKRRLVTYDEIPPQLVQAVLAIEDRRFFEHSGINYVRTVKCVVHDVLAHRKDCGGSTLTQQLARGFFLTPEKTYSRKIAELMITFQLEARFNKEQIFEMYANEIPLGQRGSFAVNGFGEAAHAYFGKDIRQLNLAECALLAGIIQRPSYFAPYKHPARATERRNLVLDSMVETGAITHAQANVAKDQPIHLAPPDTEASDAPYFVDLVHDEITRRLGDSDTAHSALRIYTSLDPELQRAATEAVHAGMIKVDELVRKYHRKGSDAPIVYPQVSLVALNPHTGQILALVGGRNYGMSQIDHALSERPTGSIFKPFVYASAFNTSLQGTNLDGNGVFTALTQINDDAQNFGTSDQPYIPGNFVKGEYPGMVTAVDALTHSLNIATIALARQIGYDNVASLARSAGIVNARGTPSMAIGTYNATPIQMAGAYTVFANNGVHLTPWALASVRNANGDIVADFAPEAKQIIDPRVAFLTQSLLQNVMAHGTGSSVRRMGFTAPAAGKTGTEHDAWFAGYTSNLLCIIWIGNDDYTDIDHGLTHKLQGADTAAPVWAEFMNRAIQIPQYSDMRPLGPAPDGVETLAINQPTRLVADDTCPTEDIPLAFLVGTGPQTTCSHMGESTQSLGSRIFSFFTGKSASPSAPAPNVPQTPASTRPPAQVIQQMPPSQPQPATPPPPAKRRNIFQKLFGGSKDKPQDSTQDNPQ